MSKYIGLYQSDSQFETASKTVDYPHVSLIDTTGESKFYRKFQGPNVIDASFGDILMAEVATDNLFTIAASEYNLTDYPLESYKPIAVCIFDRESNAYDQAVFMSVQWADYTTLGTPNPSARHMTWGFYNVSVHNIINEIDVTYTNISSVKINDGMKSLVTTDYSGSSIENTAGNGESAAFCSAWRFSTAGTEEGDWLLPSYYDISKYQENYSSINNIFETIKNVAGSSYLDTVNDNTWIAAENGNLFAVYLLTKGNFTY